MRKGRWALHLPHMILPDELVRRRPAGVNDPGARTPPWLWLTDHELDEAEAYDASARHPRVAQALAEEAHAWDRAFQTNPRGWLPQ